VKTRTALASLAAAVAITLPARGSCQDAARPASALGFSVGVADFHQRDEYLAPAAYRGTDLAGSVLFERRTARTVLAIEATASVGGINSAALPRDVEQYVARLSVAVLRALGDPDRPGRRLTLYAGGGVSTFGAITDFKATDAVYGYSYGDMSWYWSHSADLRARAEYRTAARGLAIEVTSPMIRLVSRPENGKAYNARNERIIAAWPKAITGGRMEFVWSRLAVSGRVEYRQQLGGRTRVRVAYDFAYASSDRPLPLGMYLNQLVVGLLLPI